MNYWIFNAAPHEGDGESFTGRQIYERRMQDQFWGLGERTQNRRNVRAGDQVIFYVARPDSVFVGTARLASDSFMLTPAEQKELSHGTRFFAAQYGVRIDAIEVWETPHRIDELADGLEFVKNPTQWWTYLQGGVRQISEADYRTIVSGPHRGAAGGQPSQDLAAQSLFALEAHLEDFIAHNWPKISWGAALDLYQDGEQTGRQFPAGTWSIDFLAVDRSSKDFVVIELKRGQTSDTTVGQVLRYINWVKANLASEGQNVRGIIVASQIDEALRYAARGLACVSVRTYSVTFSLDSVAL